MQTKHIPAAMTVVAGKLIVAALALALSACASVAPPSQVPVLAERVGESPAAATLDLPFRRQAGAWWSAFEDPLLDTLVREAMASNRALASSTARIDQARAILGERRLDRLPRGEVEAGRTRQRLSGPEVDPFGDGRVKPPRQDLVSVGIGATWEIDLFGRIGTARVMAERDVDIADADADALLALLQAEVVSNYLRWRSLQAQRALLRREIDAAGRVAAWQRERVAAGVDDPRAIALSEAALRTRHATLSELDAGLEATRTALAVLRGASPLQQDMRLEPQLPPPATPTLDGAPLSSDLLVRRPDVARADAVYRRALGVSVLADRAFLPSFGLDLSSGRAQRPGLLDLASAERLLIGGFLRWNPLEWGRLRAQARAADADVQAAFATLEHTILVALKDSEDKLFALRGMRDAAEAVQRAAEAAEAADRIARMRTEAGVDSRMAGDQSWLQAAEAQRRRLDAELRHALAFVDVHLALATWQGSDADER